MVKVLSVLKPVLIAIAAIPGRMRHKKRHTGKGMSFLDVRYEM